MIKGRERRVLCLLICVLEIELQRARLMIGIGEAIFSDLFGFDAVDCDVFRDNEAIDCGDISITSLPSDITVSATRFVIGGIDCESIIELAGLVIIEHEVEPIRHRLLDHVLVGEVLFCVLGVERVICQ